MLRNKMNVKLKRPIGVWIIFVTTILMYILTSINFLIIYEIIHVGISFEKEAPIFNPIVFTKMLIISGLFLFATLKLFQLKSIAVKIYLVYAILYILNKIYFYFQPISIENQNSIVENAVSTGNTIGLLLNIIVILYAIWLKKKGILKA